MKPYYKDNLITIYNHTTDILTSDVVILDPPQPLVNVTVFKAKCYIIFAGRMYPMYEEQFPDMRVVRVPWQYTVDGEGNSPDRTNVWSDCVLVAGNVLSPGGGKYHLKKESERSNRWERPLELMINLLTETSGTVLDPFMGGGNSMVACKMLGRTGIGFDIDKSVCKVAAERLAKI
jgi:hypothetical protein